MTWTFFKENYRLAMNIDNLPFKWHFLDASLRSIVISPWVHIGYWFRSIIGHASALPLLQCHKKQKLICVAYPSLSWLQATIYECADGAKSTTHDAIVKMAIDVEVENIFCL